MQSLQKPKRSLLVAAKGSEKLKKQKMDVQKLEACLRFCAVLLLLLTACLFCLDNQSKIIFYTHRRITYKKLHSFEVLVYVSFGAGAYNLLQLGRCLFSSCFQGTMKGSYRYLAWVSYLLDQIVVYGTFASNSAAVEQAILAITGVKEFEWMRWCNKFTRFCFQAGGALTCGYLASALLILVTCISAFNLFRLYSPAKFLRLKNT